MKKKWESFKRGIALFVLAQMMFALIPAPLALASTNGPVEPSEEKITICQFTNENAKNPYIQIPGVSKSSILSEGHGNKDIIPPFDGFDGSGWESLNNQAIYANNCAIPADTDGDGIYDRVDNCPFVANSDQADADGDGVGDACDNCPEVANVTQLDSNNNGTGDACEVVAPFVRSAEITSPEINELITSGTLNLTAHLLDDDYDAVQWAVRKGTCAFSTNTVIGNVDGKNTPFTWMQDETNDYKYNFTATVNVSEWEDGEYCFVFNPVEDAGESDIRLTRLFTIQNPEVVSPVIALIGDPEVSVEYGSNYIDEGATCTLGDVSLDVVNDSEGIDTLVLGASTITYTCGEGENTASTTRTLTVIKRSITVTANAATKVAGTVDPALSYELTSGTLIGGDVLAGDIEREVGEVVGEYDILQGDLTAGPNYNLVFVSALFTITPAEVTEEEENPVTPVVTAVAATPATPAPAVLGDTDEGEVTSDVTEKEAQEVKGAEETGASDRTCPWWWIVSLILVIALGIVAFIIRDKDEDNFFKKYWYAWPPALGAAAWVAHYFLHDDLRATWFCENYWLVILFLVILGEIAYKMLLKKSESNGKKK
jgi:hypothetical protein